MLQTAVAKIPDDAIEVEVKPYHIKWSKMILPKVMAAEFRPLGPDAPLADRQIRIRYPQGETSLAYYHDKEGATALSFRGEFKEWFRSGTVQLGDRIWLRVREGEGPDSDELEIGLSETNIVEAPVDNYEVVPVRPDWVDNRGLLGYLNPLTNEYSTTPFLDLLLRARAEEERAAATGENAHPFFVILDEMNLARVEHYFSDFLSALESGEDIPLHENEAIESGESESGPQVPRKLKVPGNVLFTGTVNVDETTYMFSPKVLDRAFTIEFDQVDLEGFTTGEANEEASGLDLDGVEDALDLLRSGSSGGDWKPSREDWVEFSRGHPRTTRPSSNSTASWKNSTGTSATVSPTRSPGSSTWRGNKLRIQARRQTLPSISRSSRRSCRSSTAHSRSWSPCSKRSSSSPCTVATTGQRGTVCESGRLERGCRPPP